MYDIYVATIVIIAGAALQVVVTRVIRGNFDKKQLIILAILVCFGGMTLYFHDPIFIKWKPTIVYWLLGSVLIGSQFFGDKPLMQRIMGKALEEKSIIPATIWKRLNLAWAVFFVLLGGLNVYVAYSFSTDVWVNFKLYGVLGALLIFGFIQAICLSRYMTAEK
jgi:intracellular septation protein